GKNRATGAGAITRGSDAGGECETPGERGSRNQLPEHHADSQDSASGRIEYRARDCVARDFRRLRNGRARNARADGELSRVKPGSNEERASIRKAGTQERSEERRE